MPSMSDGSPSDEKSRVSLAFGLGWQVAELFYQPSDEVRGPGKLHGCQQEAESTRERLR
jgi:hypothetical protein